MSNIKNKTFEDGIQSMGPEWKDIKKCIRCDTHAVVYGWWLAVCRNCMKTPPSDYKDEYYDQYKARPIRDRL